MKTIILSVIACALYALILGAYLLVPVATICLGILAAYMAISTLNYSLFTLTFLFVFTGVMLGSVTYRLKYARQAQVKIMHLLNL